MQAAANVEHAAMANAASLLTANEAAQLADIAEHALQALTDELPMGWDERLADAAGAGAAFGLLVSYARRWHHEAAAATRLADRLSRRRALICLRELARMRWLRCGETAAGSKAPTSPLPELGTFIQQSYELIAKRAASGAEVGNWLEAIESGRADVNALVTGLLNEASAYEQAVATAPGHGHHPCWLMGTKRYVMPAEWQARASEAPTAEPAKHRHRSRFHVIDSPRPKVSALLSLWRGGEYIARFMDNITTQDGFAKHCELIIVDAASPDHELDLIRPYLDRFDNITYVRCDERIGIYDAWNRAIAVARGAYLTSTNVDDLRRHDSLLLQAGVLDNLPSVDIVYQDVVYTLDPTLSFDAIERFGYMSRLPIMTPHTLLRYNPPHNAPMWRRALHDELGGFDTGYESAADYEFWLRCLAAGKTFYKLDDPHVAYFHNPQGLSTRGDSRGPVEARQIAARYARRLLPSNALVGDRGFIERLGVPLLTATHRGVRRRFEWAAEALRNTALGRKPA